MYCSGCNFSSKWAGEITIILGVHSIEYNHFSCNFFTFKSIHRLVGHTHGFKHLVLVLKALQVLLKCLMVLLSTLVYIYITYSCTCISKCLSASASKL